MFFIFKLMFANCKLLFQLKNRNHNCISGEGQTCVANGQFLFYLNFKSVNLMKTTIEICNCNSPPLH